MNTLKSITVFFILIFAACTTAKDKQMNEATPDAFQEKNSFKELTIKRSYDSMTEQLYKEIIDKNKDLKNLEEKINTLNEDNLKYNTRINKFLADNESYYNEVNAYATTIQDSLLRAKVMDRINSGENYYKAKIQSLITLKEELNQKILTVNEYKTALKIFLTTNSIKSYQDNFNADTEHLKTIIKGYENLTEEISKTLDDK